MRVKPYKNNEKSISIWDIIKSKAKWTLEIHKVIKINKKEGFKMNREEFLNYINNNFNISNEAYRLIDNILDFVQCNYTEENEQYIALSSLLNGSIGLTDNEIKQVLL